MRGSLQRWARTASMPPRGRSQMRCVNLERWTRFVSAGSLRLKGSAGRADEYRVMAFDLDHALRYLIAAEGSDLHLKVPSYPLIRLHGSLEPIPGTERLFPEDTRTALNQMLEDA